MVHNSLAQVYSILQCFFITTRWKWLASYCLHPFLCLLFQFWISFSGFLLMTRITVLTLSLYNVTSALTTSPIVMNTQYPITHNERWLCYIITSQLLQGRTIINSYREWRTPFPAAQPSCHIPLVSPPSCVFLLYQNADHWTE